MLLCLSPPGLSTRNCSPTSSNSLSLTHLILFLPTRLLNYTRLNAKSAFSHLLATGPELPTDCSLENPSDLTHSLTLWQPDLSLPRTIGKPLWFDAALVSKLVPCAWLLSGALEVWSLRLGPTILSLTRACGNNGRRPRQKLSSLVFSRLVAMVGRFMDKSTPSPSVLCFP